MFKKLLLILGLFSLMFISNANAAEIMYLQCDNSKNLIEDRLNSIDIDLVDSEKWKTFGHKSFYFVVFGMDWSEVNDVCYAHAAYIEMSTLERSEPYIEEVECEAGPFGIGQKHLRDSWGGHFIWDTTNTYNKTTQTCKIKTKYTIMSDKADRITWSKKRNCKLAKSHFFNGIIDPEYGKDMLQKQWQKQKCKEIPKIVFEKEVGLAQDTLISILAEDIINE